MTLSEVASKPIYRRDFIDFVTDRQQHNTGCVRFRVAQDTQPPAVQLISPPFTNRGSLTEITESRHRYHVKGSHRVVAPICPLMAECRAKVENEMLAQYITAVN